MAGQYSGTASIALYPELTGQDNRLDRAGPWALMRLLDAGTVNPKGEEIIARFAIGGRDVSYKIRVGSSYNPFFMPALSDFKCPGGFLMTIGNTRESFHAMTRDDEG